MAQKSVKVDFSRVEGIPLFKKFAMFDSGLVPLSRYERDAHLFQRCKIPSLRIDLFIGDRSMELGNMADGTAENVEYHWNASDRLVEELQKNGVSPYYSWCYVPLPVQPEGGSFRSVPTNWEKYKEIMREFARHYREQGSPLGYQEIYNEPINPGAFFDGWVDEFNTLYKYGVQGIKEGDPEALVGGSAEAFVLPAEECRENVGRFLSYVEQNDLPLDFFSFHSYGNKNKIYLTRLGLVREALSKNSRFKNAGIHINEFNTVPPPWPYKKTVLEQPALVPQILTAIQDLLEETDVELVHWAQFLESGVDALGLVDRLGRLLPGFFAFELYSRMPARRVAVDTPEEIGCMASCDENRFSALVWNRSDEAVPYTEALKGIPEKFESADVCIVDADFLELLQRDPQLRPKVRMRLPVVNGEVDFEGFTLGVYDVVYIECNARHNPKVFNKGFSVKRAMHWYPDRYRKTFAEYDVGSGSVYLGANGYTGEGTILSLEFETDEELSELLLERSFSRGKAELCIRVDYRMEDRYSKAVQFGGEPFVFERGTGRLADQVEPLPEKIPLKEKAPAGWSGKGLISFFTRDASGDYMESIRIASDAIKDAFDGMMD